MENIVPESVLLVIALLVTTGLFYSRRNEKVTVWCAILSYCIIIWCLVIWAGTHLIGALIG